MNEMGLRAPGRQRLCLKSSSSRWCLELGTENPSSYSALGCQSLGWCKDLGMKFLFGTEKSRESFPLYPCRPLPTVMWYSEVLCAFLLLQTKRLLVLLHSAGTIWSTQKFRAFEEKTVNYPLKTNPSSLCVFRTCRKLAEPMPAHCSL